MATHSSILACRIPCRIPMDSGAWWATVHVVAKRWAQLSELAQQRRLRHREQTYGQIERMIPADI